MLVQSFVPDYEDPLPVAGHRIPFNHNGSRIDISQGYNCLYSHFPMKLGLLFKIDNRFCVDFALPFGTEVIASAPGVVVYKIDDSNEFYEGEGIENGSKYLPNAIVLEHKGGFRSMYQHLGKGKVYFQEGDFVNEGDVIAKTGKSGWIGPVPHLHYALFRQDKDLKQTFPVMFKNYHGQLEHSVLYPDKVAQANPVLKHRL